MITVINESHGLFILHITQESSGFMKKESISFSHEPQFASKSRNMKSLGIYFAILGNLMHLILPVAVLTRVSS